jgi:hypothetical protein
MKKTIGFLFLLLIVTTTQAFAAVPASRRALIIINELDSTGIQELAPLYSTLETLTIGLPALPVIRNNYGVLRVLRNSSATLAMFRATARQLAANPNIDAIDVILALHGKDRKLKWADGSVNMEDTVAFMNAAGNASEFQIRSAVRRKLRMVYNTSCFGASHRSMLLTIGFDAVVGSIGVNANAEAEYPNFLAQWNLGQTFGGSFAATNTPVALAVTDGPLVATGRLLNNFLKNVNSRKVFAGNVNIRIHSDPL